MLITDFKEKKVCEYLDTGNYHNVLIIFHHGLGDAVMFWSTCMKALQRRYPTISFTYSTHLGQDMIFGKVDEDVNHYDIAFKLSYPCSEWGSRDETKSEKCWRTEIGMNKPLEEDYSLPRKFPSPLVGVHFNSTSCPSFNVKRDFGMKLWNQIQDAGFIPIDTHMRHMFDNKHSVVHDFEQCRRVDNVHAKIDKLIGLLSVLGGFAGVPSGNLVCSLCVLPSRKVLYLSSDFSKERHFHLDMFEMNIRKPYDAGVVKEWLEYLKSN